MIIAFDVDYTLVNSLNAPLYANIDILRWFLTRGHRIIIWSGGGKDYAEMWARKLGLDRPPYDVVCSEKTKEASAELKPDICFDDEIVDLAKVNIRV